MDAFSSSSTPVSKWRRLVVNLLVAILSLVVFAVLAEILVRLFDPNLFYKSQFFPKNRDIDFPQFYKRDSQLFWRFRPDQTIDSRRFSNIAYRINEHGMRGEDINTQQSATRIIALGNSCTFGWGVGLQHTWPHRLELQLDTDLAPAEYEVLNGGVPGYSTFQGRHYLPELLELRPAIVLIMFGWNDHFPAGHDICDSQQEMPPGIVLWLQNTFSRLQFYQFMRKALLSVTEERREVRLGDVSLTPRVTRDETVENLEAMITATREAGAEPVVMIPPIASVDVYLGGVRSPFHRRHAQYQQSIRKAAVITGTRLINLQPIFDQRDDLFDSAVDDPIHFNARGHWVVASTVADSLAAWYGRK